MRIDSQDIIRTVQELRDEENSRLHVRPWNGRRSHFRVPAWLVAVPAAAIVGFFFGLWTNSQQSPDTPLTAMVDTVYIKVKESVPAVDSVNRAEAAPPTPTVTPVRRVAKAKAMQQKRPSVAGLSMANDRIRYDLLVKN